MPIQSALPEAARDAILAWYAERGRPLAFRRTRDPYAILVSEAMAQQTQAARAATFWEPFMERFPTVEILAAATPADVLRAWQGLGYDRRALALRRAARIVVDEHGGRIPATLPELQALPGVGPYTARAVAALAFGMPVGAVDVNVRRVVGRIVAADPQALTRDEMQAVADDAVPIGRSRDWTHAVMDVGATICRPRAPRCGECPARPWCRLGAQDAGVPSRQPARRARTSAAGTSALAFTTTRRWLRGRILDRLRGVADGEWVTLDFAIGSHDRGRVRAAAQAMAGDGILEIGTMDDPGATLRARLPLG